jgi:hypothetical protein
MKMKNKVNHYQGGRKKNCKLFINVQDLRHKFSSAVRGLLHLLLLYAHAPVVDRSRKLVDRCYIKELWELAPALDPNIHSGFMVSYIRLLHFTLE